ncbi:MAG: hypothetical protein ACIAS6_02130 [Phycisphaerales bacterium JB060]
MNTRPPAGRASFFASVAIALVAATAVTVLALALPPETSTPLFEETGPFEQASPWLWLALALFIPLAFRSKAHTVAAGMIIACAAAAREWDWHIAFTDYSMLKPPFYYREGSPLEVAIAGAVMVLVIASVVVLVARLVQLKPWKRPLPWWVLALGFAFFMLVFTKVVDRAPAILRDDLGLIDLDEHPRIRVVCYAIEEGLEMLLPVFFGAYALALARWHKARRPAGDSPRT